AERLRNYESDVIITAAYGKILPGEVLRIPSLGCINVHASLLPKYRGAAPIWRAIINGEKKSGVTTMFMDEGIDTGDIILSKEIKIPDDMNVGVLYGILAEEGAVLLEETLKRLKAGNLKQIPQDNGNATYAPIITKEDGRINWSKDAFDVHNLVRGMDPWPGAYTFLHGEMLKIWNITVESADGKYGVPGEIYESSGGVLKVACGNGSVKLNEIQGIASKRMKVADYVNGHKVTAGSMFSFTH
ncbi:MAG: methionyl-tRNA formyltransferase, partial [Clostridiales bacterium]|nr:methionyl-tRNA formyltransferase [Clostridiales bacterium]